jgi:phosphate transport system permease protein
MRLDEPPATDPRARTDGPGPSARTPKSRGPVPEERLRLRPHGRADWPAMGGAAASAFCLVWLIYERLTPLSGGLGFWLSWYAAFLAIYALTARDRFGRVQARDKLATVVVTSVGIGLVVALAFIVGYTTYRGVQALRFHFFLETQRQTGPLDKATAGGAAHAIVGTLEQVGLAMAMSVPLGVATAVFLNEVGGRLARPLRLVVDAMSAIPSIVAGLFIFAVVILGLGRSFSGFNASLALAVLMLPTVTRTSEVVLRLVPGGLREGALALGSSEWRMARLVILPTARTGLITAVILGVARAVGETAPLLLTAGGTASMQWNPFAGPQEALPLFIYRQIRSSSDSYVTRGWTAAFVLLAIVLILFVLARTIGGRAPGQTERGWFRWTRPPREEDV